ncbi:MAG: presenilin family intramembrane aspartyl protease [Candidatus Woesearchaeota archaeon]
MKHNLQATIIILFIFVLSQLVGLMTLTLYFNYNEVGEIEYKELPLQLERPEVEESKAWIYIFIAIIIGTALLLFLIKIQSRIITKTWFFLAIFIGLIIALSAYIGQNGAIIIAFIITYWRMFYPNTIIHNLSEILIYGGIAVLFHEMLTVFWVAILLFLIAIYDMIAVWKLKHMITMAKFQTNNNLFAGAFLPYKKNILLKPSKKTKNLNTKSVKKTKKQDTKTAVLGGGDMAFPLFFTGAILKQYGLIYAFIPIIFSTLALTYLFIRAEKDKFYPAMPYLTTGCLIAWAVIIAIVH